MIVKFRHTIFSVIIFIFFCISCSQIPSYTRPYVQTPEDWRFKIDTSKTQSERLWWQSFGDPVLNSLIEEGLKANHDILIATARVEEYIGRYMSATGGLYPQVNLGGTAIRSRATTLGETFTGNNFNLNFNLNWEIDFWGRLKGIDESAKAQLLSAEESKQAVLLTIVSAIAESYLNLLSLDEQLRIAQETAKSRKDYYEIFQLRFQGGVISELELKQAKSEYESTLATIPNLQRQIAQQESALSILIGSNPKSIQRGKSLISLNTPLIPAGLPSDLLQRRPDIRQAENDLISANAQIGVARASFFPTISLTGAFGWASGDLTDLLKDTSRVWNFGGSATAPIFRGGTLRGNLKTAEALQQQALLKYQQSIQKAFKEVEDALIENKMNSQQLEIQQRQVSSLRDYAGIARMRYENGYTSYIEVLDAERSLFNAELSMTQTKTALIKSVISLYKSLGGQWFEADKK
ncbi:MAG: efflux transporter outer membrane subunit [Thermodesulfovibrionales bacterium]|nr:efflux transporter outer membrane subunit [Thermodesulfovibrionales bacterium]